MKPTAAQLSFLARSGMAPGATFDDCAQLIESLMPTQSQPPAGAVRPANTMTIETESPSLFEAVKAAGIPYANHESDLYLPDTPAVRSLLDRFPANRTNARGFTNQAPPHKGERWLDIPFAFLPWWERRRNLSRS